MSEPNQYCKCYLKYQQLSPIDTNVLTQIKLVFIFSNSEATDIVFVTNMDDVYAFGTNSNGKLGFGNSSPVKEPTIVTELCGRSLMNIQSTTYFMIGLTQRGDVYTWGYDHQGWGVLGNGSRNVGYLKPTKINLNNQLVTDIRCGQTRTFLLTQNDQIYWFGYTYDYNFDDHTSVCSPTHIESLCDLEITQISCGLDHTLVLTVTGQVYSWGTDYHGCLGLGPIGGSDTPQLVDLNSVIIFVKRISCGNSHNLLLTSDGDIYSFGYNSNGQLGTGDTVDQNRPKLIETSDFKFCEIFARNDLSIAINNTKNVVIWGHTKKGNYTSPTKIDTNSFQQTINNWSDFVFTYKPLSSADIFTDKPQNEVIETMAKAFNNPKNSDLKFKVLRKQTKDQFEYIYCHKWFIEASSQYFETMFAHNNGSESESDVVDIPQYSFEAYYQYIQCLYTNYIQTKDIEILIELLSITNEYLDEKRKTKCVQRIKPLINDQNVCSVYSGSIHYRSKQLEEYCFEFMSKHMDIVCKTEDFDKMDSNYAKDFFKKLFTTKIITIL